MGESLENSNRNNERPSRFRNAMNAATVGIGLGLGAAGGAADAAAAEPTKMEQVQSERFGKVDIDTDSGLKETIRAGNNAFAQSIEEAAGGIQPFIDRVKAGEKLSRQETEKIKLLWNSINMGGVWQPMMRHLNPKDNCEMEMKIREQMRTDPAALFSPSSLAIWQETQEMTSAIFDIQYGDSDKGAGEGGLESPNSAQAVLAIPEALQKLREGARKIESMLSGQ